VTWPTIAAIYFIVWWIVLFAVLPFGVRSAEESGEEVTPGNDPGAPVLHGLLAKVMWTTVIATVVCGGFYYVYVNRLVSLDDLASLFGLLRR
jgi:predicted secreted protein